MTRYRLAAAAAVVLGAACFPLLSLGLTSAPHLTFAFLRAAIAGGGLLAVAVALRRPVPRAPREWAGILVAGLGMTGFGYLGMVHAAERVAPGLATLVANTQPLMTAVLATTVLHERLGRRGWAGLVLGFAGVAIAAAPQALAGIAPAGLGVGYALLAAAGVACGNVAIKTLAARTDPAMAMGLQLVVGSLALAGLAALTEDVAAVRWSGSFVIVLLALSLPGTALAFWLWQLALRELPLSQANAFAFLTPAVALVIGRTAFAERIDALILAGAGIAAAGVYLGSTPPVADRPGSGRVPE